MSNTCNSFLQDFSQFQDVLTPKYSYSKTLCIDELCQGCPHLEEDVELYVVCKFAHTNPRNEWQGFIVNYKVVACTERKKEE